MRVLVTGATGFLGVHIVRAFVDAGHEVLGLDIRKPDACARAFLDARALRAHLTQADITDRRQLEESVAGPLDGVVHSAVLTSTPEVETADPERVVTVNLIGTAEVLRLAQARGARRFVYVSSSGVYGNTDPAVPITESHPLQLHGLYAMTKYASECLVASARTHDRLEAASARIAAPYGPMERPTGARTLMSIIYRMTHAAVDGRGVSLACPSRGRDWTYADDIAGGLRLLLETPDLDHACYNLSSGTLWPLAEVARILEDLAPGFHWSTDAGAAGANQAGTQRRGPLDLCRLRALGFRPRYTLEDGLRETVQWIRRMRAEGSPTTQGGIA